MQAAISAACINRPPRAHCRCTRDKNSLKSKGLWRISSHLPDRHGGDLITHANFIQEDAGARKFARIMAIPRSQYVYCT
jgi:hypothetical protein